MRWKLIEVKVEFFTKQVFLRIVFLNYKEADRGKDFISKPDESRFWLAHTLYLYLYIHNILQCRATHFIFVERSLLNLITPGWVIWPSRPISLKSLQLSSEISVKTRPSFIERFMAWRYLRCRCFCCCCLPCCCPCLCCRFLCCCFLCCRFLCCRFLCCRFLCCRFLCCRFPRCRFLCCHFLRYHFLCCCLLRCRCLLCRCLCLNRIMIKSQKVEESTLCASLCINLSRFDHHHHHRHHRRYHHQGHHHHH